MQQSTLIYNFFCGADEIFCSFLDLEDISMKKNILLFIAGALTASLIITPVISFAETTQTISAVFDKIKLVVDGEDISAQTILYNGTTYVPIRAAATALGANVSYDDNTAYISMPKQQAVISSLIDGSYEIIGAKDEADPKSLIVSNATTNTFDFELKSSADNEPLKGTAKLKDDSYVYNPSDIDMIKFEISGDKISVTESKGLYLPSGKAVYIKLPMDKETADADQWKSGTYTYEADMSYCYITNVNADTFDFVIKAVDNTTNIVKGTAKINGNTAVWEDNGVEKLSFTLTNSGIRIDENKTNILTGPLYYVCNECSLKSV